MSVKSILRFVIGFAIALGILSFAVPFANIPRSQLFAPILVYPSIKGRTTGMVTKRRDLPTSAWFRMGDRDYFIEYAFLAKSPLILGGPPPGKMTQYTGSVGVSAADFEKVKAGQKIPVRFDPTYPDINGVDAPWGGRSGIGASRMISGWIFWFFGTIALGYVIAPLVERIALRESY